MKILCLLILLDHCCLFLSKSNLDPNTILPFMLLSKYMSHLLKHIFWNYLNNEFVTLFFRCLMECNIFSGRYHEKCFIIAWRWYYLTCNSTPTLSNFGQHKHMVYLTIVMYNFLKFAAKNVSDNLCKGLGCYRSYWRVNCLD